MFLGKVDHAVSELEEAWTRPISSGTRAAAAHQVRYSELQRRVKHDRGSDGRNE